MKLVTLGALIGRGSAKDKYEIPGTKDIAFRFKPTFSVFDVGEASYTIPGKDTAICACAIRSFMIAKQIGIPTHFVEQLDDITIRIKRAQVITDRPLTTSDRNYVVPAEWIYRLKVAGSLHRAFVEGTKNPADYGLRAGKVPMVGTPLPYPNHHFTTKFEDLDRDITFNEACGMTGLTREDVFQFWSMIDRTTGAIALALSNGFDDSSFSLVDGKMECLIGSNREKMLGDVFGTPDEDRFCIIGADGTLEHYSKEYLRQIFIEMGYYGELKAARAAKQPDPPIPNLPQDVIAEVSRRYLAVAAGYAGVRIAA